MTDERLNLDLEHQLIFHVRLLELLLANHLHGHHQAKLLLLHEEHIAKAPLSELLAYLEILQAERSTFRLLFLKGLCLHVRLLHGFAFLIAFSLLVIVLTAR